MRTKPERTLTVEPLPAIQKTQPHFFHRLTHGLASHRARLFGASLILLFLCLRFAHLKADFPARLGSDWDKYTDEGWHTHAAVLYTKSGHWYVPGDFNVAVSVPLLQILEFGIFRVFGVGVTPARALVVVTSMLSLLFTYLLVRELEDTTTAEVVTAVLATSYFEFSFSRLVLLEYPTLLFAVAGLYFLVRQKYWLAGVTFGLTVLVKMTTGIAFVPAVYLLWVRSPTRKDFARGGAIIVSCIALALLAQYVLLVNKFPEDFRYYAAINVKYRASSSDLILSLLRCLYHGFRFVDPVLFPTALVAIAGGSRTRQILRRPLFASCALWLVGYGFYLTILHYSPPRYFIVPMLPLICCLATVIRNSRPLWGRILIAITAISMCVNVYNIVVYLETPQYSFANMAADVKNIAETDCGQHALVMGNFANTLTLLSGVPSINDDFGIRPLQWRVSTYRPTHYVSMGPISADYVEAFREAHYVAKQVKLYSVFSDSSMPLVLYRLHWTGGVN